MSLFRCYGELEVLALGFVGSDRNRSRLCSEPLMPRRDLVGARIEPGDRELPVGAGHREEGVGEHGQVGAHPGVDVALDVEHVLRLGEHRRRFLERRRHALVERRVDLRQRVDELERSS